MLFRSNDTATTEIYTLSLHDALPICGAQLAEVVGNKIGRHLQEVPELTVALHTFHQQVENEQALRLSQYLQAFSQSFQIDGRGRRRL